MLELNIHTDFKIVLPIAFAVIFGLSNGYSTSCVLKTYRAITAFKILKNNPFQLFRKRFFVMARARNRYSLQVLSL